MRRCCRPPSAAARWPLGLARLLDELDQWGSPALRADIHRYRGFALALPGARLGDLERRPRPPASELVPESAGTLELIARELATALQPLEDRLAAGNAEALLVELGIQLPGGVAGAATATATVAVKAGELAPLIVALTDAIDDEDAARILSTGVALLNKIKEVVDAIGALKPAFATAVAAAGGLTPAQRAHVQAEVSGVAGRGCSSTS